MHLKPENASSSKPYWNTNAYYRSIQILLGEIIALCLTIVLYFRNKLLKLPTIREINFCGANGSNNTRCLQPRHVSLFFYSFRSIHFSICSMPQLQTCTNCVSCCSTELCATMQTFSVKIYIYIQLTKSLPHSWLSPSAASGDIKKLENPNLPTLKRFCI